MHEDGSPHIHALGVWLKRKNIISATAFDVDGYHPNIQCARNVKDVFQYVIKDGNYIKNCDFSSKRKYSEIVEQSDSADAFISGVLQEYPRDVVLHLKHIKYFADWKWKDIKDEYTSAFQEWNISNAMKSWVDQEMTKVGELFSRGLAPLNPLRRFPLTRALLLRY